MDFEEYKKEVKQVFEMTRQEYDLYEVIPYMLKKRKNLTDYTVRNVSRKVKLNTKNKNPNLPFYGLVVSRILPY